MREPAQKRDAVQVPAQLSALIRQQGSQASSPAVRALADSLLSCYGEAVQAILFYGSCFRTGDDADGLVDLYVLVDDYCSLSPKWTHICFYKLLPPTVFYLEIPFTGRVVRAKYTVLSLADFQRGTSMRWFHSYLWGRFAQPTGLVYVRNEQVAEQVHTALAQAVLTFVIRVLPLLPPSFDARELWERGLSFSYRAELRAERPHTVERLIDAAPDYYEQVTRAAMEAIRSPNEVVSSLSPIRYEVHILPWRWYRGRFAWAIRRMQGKLLSVLRLLKGLFTFRGGIDYILWKIERHSGVTVEVTPRLQRYPLLARGVLLWRLYRLGAFR